MIELIGVMIAVNLLSLAGLGFIAGMIYVLYRMVRAAWYNE